jgi:hypothetical protein
MRQPDNLPAFCRVHRNGRPLIGRRGCPEVPYWRIATQIKPSAPGLMTAKDREGSALPAVVKLVMTILWMWGCGRACGLVWCSKEATTHCWGLTGENRVRPVCCRSSSAAWLSDQARDQMAWT